MEVIQYFSKILAIPFLAFIAFYQFTLSPDHGWLKVFYPYGYCKFYPSCSQYAKIVLQKEGLLGFAKIIKRIFSCRPKTLPRFDQPYL